VVLIFFMSDSNPSISKAEKRIKLLSEKVGASEEGTLWIKECLDPFSDTPRRPVGFPDLITGNSVIQVVKQTKTISIGATPQDCHIFMDTLDTDLTMYANPFYDPATPSHYAGALNITALGGDLGVQTHRGGVVVRKGPVGGTLNASTYVDQIKLPVAYTAAGATRVLSKAFEVHNTTNKLNVGGAVTVYRDTGAIPYGDQKGIQCYAAGSDTISSVFTGRHLSHVPESLSEVTRIPGSQQWEAKDGCYNVATMAAQTNNPTDEEYGIAVMDDSSSAGLYINATVGAPGKPPIIPDLGQSPLLFSPFFLSGAYFSGLPAGTELTINSIYIIERFVDASNLDLIVLAQPSPYYDPVAMEIYSKTCMRLPHGVKAGDNADGDWIKNIADVLSTFGVPGMPVVKGAVDLYNTYQNSQQPKQEKQRAAQHQNRLKAEGAVVGSPSKSTVQRAKAVQPKQPAPKKVPAKAVQPKRAPIPNHKNAPKKGYEWREVKKK